MSTNMKQDNLYYEYNKETDKLDILWILQAEDGTFYQKTKSINIRKLLDEDKAI